MTGHTVARLPRCVDGGDPHQEDSVAMAEVDDSTEQQTWKQYGACGNMNPVIFFPARGESAEPAKAACRSCVVQTECAEWGINNERHGVWGGLSERERRRIRRQRRVQLPPNQAVAVGKGSTGRTNRRTS